MKAFVVIHFCCVVLFKVKRRKNDKTMDTRVGSQVALARSLNVVCFTHATTKENRRTKISHVSTYIALVT